MWRLKACPRCGGDLHFDQDGYGQYAGCLQCGYQSTTEAVNEAVTKVEERKDVRSMDLENMTTEQKREIALEAKEVGFILTAEKYGLPRTMVRGWVGAYTRKPKQPNVVKEVAPVIQTQEITSTPRDADRDELQFLRGFKAGIDIIFGGKPSWQSK